MGLEWNTEADLRESNRTWKVGCIVLEGGSTTHVHYLFIHFNNCIVNAYCVPGIALETIYFLAISEIRKRTGNELVKIL